nr:spidroin-1-like [Aegilops tauschii subsp. strangulata]
MPPGAGFGPATALPAAAEARTPTPQVPTLSGFKLPKRKVEYFAVDRHLHLCDPNVHLDELLEPVAEGHCEAAAAAVQGQVEALLKKFHGFISAPLSGDAADPAAGGEGENNVPAIAGGSSGIRQGRAGAAGCGEPASEGAAAGAEGRDAGREPSRGGEAGLQPGMEATVGPARGGVQAGVRGPAGRESASGDSAAAAGGARARGRSRQGHGAAAGAGDRVLRRRRRGPKPAGRGRVPQREWPDPTSRPRGKRGPAAGQAGRVRSRPARGQAATGGGPAVGQAGRAEATLGSRTRRSRPGCA